MVLGREGAQAFDLRGTLREQFSRFGEELFEPRRRDDFHQTGHFVGRIPERVRDCARLQDVVARTRQENLVADSSAELTFHDVGILVRVMVQMRWNESSRLEGMFDDGKRPVCFVARDFELDPDSTYRNKLAFFRRNRQTAMVLLSPIHSNRRARASSNPDDKFLRAGDAAMSSRRGTSRNKYSAPAGEARPCQRRGLTPQGRGTTAPPAVTSRCSSLGGCRQRTTIHSRPRRTSSSRSSGGTASSGLSSTYAGTRGFSRASATSARFSRLPR